MNAMRPPLMRFVLAGLLAACGCTTTDDHTRHIVADSGLNWVEIAYLPGRGQPPIQISLLGVGHMRIKRGASPLVTDSFSINVASADWNDITADQINVPREEMRAVFQALVDRGVLAPPDKDFLAAAGRGGPIAKIRGLLDSEAVNRQAVEPELLAYIRDLVKSFDQASPQRGAGGANQP